MNLAREQGPAPGQDAGGTPGEHPAALPESPPAPGSPGTARAWRIICTIMSATAVLLLIYDGGATLLSRLALSALFAGPWIVYMKWGRE